MSPATLYRHFPTKTDLLDAVFDERVRELVDAVRLAHEAAEPADALRAAVHSIVDVQIRDRSFRDLLTWRDTVTQAQLAVVGELGDLLRTAVDTAREAGVLRPEVTFPDLALLLIGLDEVSGSAGRLSPEAVHRVAELAVDGLCGTTTPLQGSPLDVRSLRAASKRP